MEIKKIDEFTFEIPKSGTMKVPARVFASKIILDKIKEDGTLQQLKNMASLPGIVKYAMAMADAHRGYGYCIGGVTASYMKDGVISPGGIGYDINCGVRLLSTNLDFKDVMNKRKDLLENFFQNVPCGIGKKGKISLSREELKKLLVKGSKWALEKGYATKEELEKTEEGGCMPGANPNVLSPRALKRGLSQIGTLGAGNHFLEIQKVDKIYDKKIAKIFGVEKEGQVMVMIHSGSRGLGHQVASDYIKKMEDKYGFEDLADRELINAPINSELGREYYEAMCCAVNFAFANRQLICHWTKEAFKEIIKGSEIKQVYDIAHNIAKFEKHIVNGEEVELCVSRKGATRSFGAGREEIPEVYREVGQPVIIPGSMGTASYLLVGTSKAEEISFGSTAHGAGRVMSRFAAKKAKTGEKVIEELNAKDIEVKGASIRGIAEESPGAYKDIDEVIRVSHGLGIGNKVARLVPLGVVKG